MWWRFLVVIQKPTESMPSDAFSPPLVPDMGDGVRRVDVRDLLGGQKELCIVHGGREYRLRVTSKGKLILTA